MGLAKVAWEVHCDCPGCVHCDPDRDGYRCNIGDFWRSEVSVGAVPKQVIAIAKVNARERGWRVGRANKMRCPDCKEHTPQRKKN